MTAGRSLLTCRRSLQNGVAQRSSRGAVMTTLKTSERTMRVGLDIDGLLDERPEFFALLSAALRAGGHFVAILTYRDPAREEHTHRQLAAWGVVFDELHFARSLPDKGRLCRELQLDVYFDDQDECVAGVDESTT